MNPRLRMLVAVVAAALGVSSSPSLARAAGDGWFDPSQKPAPAPNPAPAPPPPADGAPAPLAPSPLYGDGAASAAEVNDQDPQALTKFRPYLDPYGTWLDDPAYGRVWVPSPGVVGPNFQPYVSNGRWALDESGEWVWVSDYSFGWVVFHYGRWVWIGNRGWAWIPGYRYAPAWVVWRVPTGSYDYVGWAPAPPTFVWFGGLALHWGYDPYYAWVFCPSPYLFHYHVHSYVVRDRYWVGYAARHTRPYVPASPRHRTSAPAAYPRSPTLSAARVPSHAVPRERAPAYTPSGVRAPPGTHYDGPRATRRAEPQARPFDDRGLRPLPSFRDRPSRAPAVDAPRPSPSRSRPDVRVPGGSRRVPRK